MESLADNRAMPRGGRIVACLSCLIKPAGRAAGFLSSPVCRPLAGLLLALALSLAAAIGALVFPTAAAWLLGMQALLLPLAIGAVVLLYHRMDAQLLEPLIGLREWAVRMRRGDLGARVAEPPGGEFIQLALDINQLSDELRRLNEEMDSEVCKHTESLAQKTRSLQVLYDVAASINIFNDLEDLLTRFLHTLIDVVKARAAAVRLLDKDGQMRLVASVGLSESDLEKEQVVPADQSVWGTVVAKDEGEGVVEKSSPRTLQGGEHLHAISVPLRYHGQTLGVYNLFVDRPELIEREDIGDLLTSIGRHLGMAIEKVRVDNQAQRLSIMQERSLLAHELHDSLAQTLASLRFQVRMLDDTLEQGELEQARRELDKIRNSLEEANTELRGLLAQFRAPIDKRGLVPALEDILARFRRETGIVTFFQKECSQADMPASMEMQVLRIVQEALANIRKHSRAHAVRILLRCDRSGQYHVMVEDDGIGMTQEALEGEPGEHLGLTILEERARRLGGELSIESEPAEGTRIELNFRLPRSP